MRLTAHLFGYVVHKVLLQLFKKELCDVMKDAMFLKD